MVGRIYSVKFDHDSRLLDQSVSIVVEERLIEELFDLSFRVNTGLIYTAIFNKHLTKGIRR